MKMTTSPEKLSLKAAIAEQKNEEGIEKIIIGNKPKNQTKKEVKTKIIKTSNSKFINKYGSTQSLISNEIVR